MGQFLYFMPGVKSDARSAVNAAGLSDRLDRYGFAEWDSGPKTTGAGLVVSRGEQFAPVPADECWVGPFPFADKSDRWHGKTYWIGMHADAQPGPIDLLRNEVVEGQQVVLEDGNPWMVPSARLAPRGIVGRNGSLIFKPLERFANLYADFERLGALFRDMGERHTAGEKKLVAETHYLTLCPIIADALSANYRIGPSHEEEVALLELFSESNIHLCAYAVLDLAGIAEMLPDDQKKTVPQSV